MTTSARGLSFAARIRSMMPTTGAVARTVIALAPTFATSCASTGMFGTFTRAVSSSTSASTSPCET